MTPEKLFALVIIAVIAMAAYNSSNSAAPSPAPTPVPTATPSKRIKHEDVRKGMEYFKERLLDINKIGEPEKKKKSKSSWKPDLKGLEYYRNRKPLPPPTDDEIFGADDFEEA